MVILATLDSDFIATVLKNLQFSSEHIIQFSSNFFSSSWYIFMRFVTSREGISSVGVGISRSPPSLPPPLPPGGMGERCVVMGSRFGLRFELNLPSLENRFFSGPLLICFWISSRPNWFFWIGNNSLNITCN